MNFHLQCLLLLVASAVLWSTGGVIIKCLDWPPLGIAAGRSFFSVFALLLLNRRHRPIKHPTKSQLAVAVLLALVSATFIFATKLTTAANAIFLQYTAPIWVALLAPLLLKEPTRREDWLFIAIVFCGMAMFFLDDITPDSMAGIGLAIVSGVIYAGLAMALRHEDEEGRMAGLIYGNAILACLGIFVFRPCFPQLRDILLLAVLGSLQFGLSYHLYALASRGVTALEMTLVTTLEPILNPVWVFLGTGERPSIWALAGGCLVLAAVTLWGVSKAHAGRMACKPARAGER